MNTLDQDPDAMRKQLGFACLTTAVGGLLLGVQLDSVGNFVGTGYTTLGIGALISLVVVVASSIRAAHYLGSAWLPRDGLAALGVATAFFGFACVLGAVLAPGGPWMFFEVALLLILLVLRRGARVVGPGLTPGIVAVLAVMLLFRLWITFQGSEHRWAVLEVEIPIISGLPFAFLDPVRTVSLGELTPGRLGFPPAGLNFNASTMIWAIGFTLTIVGILWLGRAAREHEDDRVHATILELPGGLAALVGRLLPEEEWSDLGLHGLSDRRRQKRIETLVRERMQARQEVDLALQHMDLGSMRIPDAFTGQMLEILGRDATPTRPPSVHLSSGDRPS